MEIQTRGCFLWVTGLDAKLKQINQTEEIQEFDYEDYFIEDFYRKIHDRLLYNPYHIEYIEKCYDGFYILQYHGVRSLIISTRQLSIDLVIKTIKDRSVAQVIFLRAPQNFPKREFVYMAADLGYTFITQKMPDIKLSPSDTLIEYDQSNKFLNAQTNNININNVKGKVIIINNENSNQQNNKPTEEKERSKRLVEYLGDFAVQFLAGLLTNGCCLLKSFTFI